LIQICFFQL